MPRRFGLQTPEGEFTILGRKRLMNPFIEAGFERGYTPSELFSKLAGTDINLPSDEFFSFVNRKYATLERAAAAAEIPEGAAFNVSDLPQQKIRMPNRFHADYDFGFRVKEGKEIRVRRTLGFDDVLTNAELDALAQEVYDESPEKEKFTRTELTRKKIFKNNPDFFQEMLAEEGE